ncbi:MAG: HPP family protein [Sedimentisphaerales bacterium]|nr:HPP family protein [Sedimentisphaerales bacterium]
MKAKHQITWKARWQLWHARYTTPALLSRFGERNVVAVVTGVNAALGIFVLSLFTWLTDLPLVFPALGPSSFILFSSPLSKPAAPRSVIMGHWVCLTSGYTAWRITSLLTEQTISVDQNGWPLMLSASLALGLGGLLMVSLDCPHPPACASALVVAIGAVTSIANILLMAGVVVWLTYQAVAINRFGGLPVGRWRYQPRVE